MFGLGKKDSKKEESAVKPKASKAEKSSSSSGGKFDFVQFLLEHGEKFVIGIVAVAAGYFLWSGWSTKTIDEAKNSADLIQQASTTRNQAVNENHWEPLRDSEKEKELRKSVSNFRAQSDLSRIPTDAGPYRPDVWENVNRSRGGKRGDPVIVAPVNLKTGSFMGAIAINSSRAAVVEELPGADPLDSRRTRRKPDDPEPPVRSMPDGTDFGYEAKETKLEKDETGRVKSDSQMSVPAFAVFAAVTAAVPHKQLVESYNAEFENAPEYNPDRDSPNYLGFEVQRVDTTTITDFSKITEQDWKSLPDVSGAVYESMVEKWPGTCKETALESYTVDKLTMKIPPILLASYNDLVDHPKIPQTAKKAANAGGSGYGSGYGGGPMQDYSSAYGSGYGAGPRGGGPGGPGGPSGQYGAAVVEEVDPEDVSKAQTLTDYKLLRFFDFTVEPGHTYVYRTRLILEDPNYPRSKTAQPKTSTMKAETVKRVQDLIDADKPRIAADKKAKRTSRIYSQWSDMSESVNVPSQSRIFAGVDSSVVYGEWDPALATLVPTWEQKTFAGRILGGAMVKSGELDVIAPISKKIKKVTDYAFSNAVTIAEVAGNKELAASPARQDLRTASEVIAFDAGSGELIVSREFDDYSNYRLYSFSDEREKIKKEKEEKAK